MGFAHLPSIATSQSGSLNQARKRALALYRDWIRSAPDVVDMYKLDVSSRVLRHKIREQFEKNRYVSDIKIIDILLFKGRIEYEETMNLWKQKTHVMRYFSNDVYERKPQTFLEHFYLNQ
ncbi:hypothetical protein EDD86DRAFT_277445 [Gorgonomyces haynaldii]|nr:hypothetical protein EDD86DRAFT_277445 [Gorgonomyces haynaldii]